VDCNSKPPYKAGDGYTLVKVPEPFNIARCLNEGYAATKGEWLLFSGESNPFYGRKHSEETKRKISCTQRKRLANLL